MRETQPSLRVSWPFVGFVALAALLLIAGHRAHLFGYFPFLFLLACPFLHMFGHRQHRRHPGHGQERMPADRLRSNSYSGPPEHNEV